MHLVHLLELLLEREAELGVMSLSAWDILEDLDSRALSY